MFTRDQIEEIKKKLIMLGTKDTQFPDAHKLNGEEIIAIVQDGENKKIPLSSIINDDFINVSKDTTEILTLSTAVSKIDINNRKLGQVITFKDSANSWAIRQFTGSSLDNWNDISLWKSISGIDELKSQVETNAENISVLSDEIERHDASILNLNTDVSKLKDKDIETSSSLSELTTRVDTLKSQADANTSNISSLNTEVSAMQSKVDENTTSISQINNNIADNNKSIAQINTTLEEHADSINANITTDRIENGAVTSEKIATSAFDSTLSVSGKIAPADVVGRKLTDLKEKIDALALGLFYGYFPDSASLPTDVTILGYAYVGLDNPYKIWNFNGESWSDSGTSIDMNDADEEDITRNTDGKLQFNDRAYGDGMGYVILRKDKTFAEQVTKENTIYEIRYDFDLSGEEVTIPLGCILKFEGGEICNGIVNLLNTLLINEKFERCQINGTIKNKFINVQDWGADATGEAYCTEILQSAVDSHNGESKVSVYIPIGEYRVNSPIYVPDNVEIFGDGSKTVITNDIDASFKYRSVFVTCWAGDYAKGTSPTNPINTGGTQLTDIIGYGGTAAEIITQIQANIGEVICIVKIYDNHRTAYIEKVIGKKEGSLLLEHTLPLSESELISCKASRVDGSAYSINQFVSKDIIIRDMYLRQTEGKIGSGYAIFGGGYNCIYRDLYFDCATSIGSNLSAYCVFENISAICYNGMMDISVCSYRNRFTNITLNKREPENEETIGNNIPFNFSNGIQNQINGLYLYGNGCVTERLMNATNEEDAVIENMEVRGFTFNGDSTISSVMVLFQLSPYKMVFKELRINHNVFDETKRRVYLAKVGENIYINGAYIHDNAGFDDSNTYLYGKGAHLSNIYSEIMLESSSSAGELLHKRIYNRSFTSGTNQATTDVFEDIFIGNVNPTEPLHSECRINGYIQKLPIGDSILIQIINNTDGSIFKESTISLPESVEQTFYQLDVFSNYSAGIDRTYIRYQFGDKVGITAMTVAQSGTTIGKNSYNIKMKIVKNSSSGHIVKDSYTIEYVV